MQELFAPTLASSLSLEDVDKFFNNNAYAFEQKIDGQRVAVVVNNGQATAVGRRNILVVDPEIMNTIETLRLDCVLDGELINGKYLLFDAPRVSSLVSTDTTYTERRAALAVLCDTLTKTTNKIQLLPSYRTSNNKEEIFRWCNENGTEGIVVKHLESPYVCGKRTEHWLKVKFVKTCEAFVMETVIDGKRNAAVGMYDDNGNIVNIGTVSMTDRRLNVVKRGDVIEIRYLYASEDSRLVQPHMLKFRPDKQMKECTIDQLKFTNKSIVFKKG